MANQLTHRTRTLNRPRRWTRMAAVVAMAVLPAASTLAQPTPASKNVPMTPPTPPTGGAGATPSAPWQQWLLAVMLLLMIVGVNCIPSKRGHLD